MDKVRTYIAIAGTAACALGIGFFMQYGRDVPSAQAPHSQSAAAPVETTIETPVESSAAEIVSRSDLDLTGAVLVTANVAAQTKARVLPDVATDVATDAGTLPRTPADPVTPAMGCPLQAQATETAAALIRVTLQAPCFPNERVTLHHNGMMFTEITDLDGNLTVEIPALAEQAYVIAAFANGKGAVARTRVVALAGFDRVVLQWSGGQGFQIHAREYGAAYGEAGHVWSGSAHTSADADAGAGGFVTRLGNPDTLAPQIAEVYTFPTASARRPGTVALSVEAEVTGTNCGRDLSAQVLGMSPGQPLRTRDLTLAIPDCSAVGDFLVLNNLVDDLKIAGK